MYIKATIQSSTGRFRAQAEWGPPNLHAIEFNSPHTIEWEFPRKCEVTITAAYDTGHAKLSLKDAGRGHLERW